MAEREEEGIVSVGGLLMRLTDEEIAGWRGVLSHYQDEAILSREEAHDLLRVVEALQSERAENARLRATLEHYAERDHGQEDYSQDEGPLVVYNDGRHRHGFEWAREALAEQKEAQGG
jgi:hypothetical protein